MNNLALNTVARTVLRVVVGFLFAAHGWQKYNEFTITGTQGAFAQMGVPAADVVAPIIATLELVGGIALILGLATRPFAALLTLNMLAPSSWSTPRQASSLRPAATSWYSFWVPQPLP